MSKEQLSSFLESVNTDAALQEKLNNAAEPDAVAAIAQSAGFESVSAELVTDFLEYVAAQSASAQETEQELSAVSGGLSAVAIAGIVSGSVAGAAVVGVASYLAYQANSDNPKDRQYESSKNHVDPQNKKILEDWNKLNEFKLGWD